MPRRKKKSEESEEEESEWEEKSQSSSDDDDDDSDHVVAESASEEEETPPDDEDDEDFEQVPKKKKKKKAPAPSKPRKRKQPAFFAEASDDEDEAALLPTHVRKTARGGYAHTNKSKSKISKANRGNTPWNKGKNRSAAVKAKISAGVRARNKVRLLKKLRKLGMTEDEYNAKQKQIKFLRERVRVTKMKKSWGRPGVKKRPADDDSSDDEEEESSQAAEEKEEGMEALEEDQAPEQVASTEQKKSGDDANEKDSQPTEAAAGPIPSTIFAKEIEFTSHAFDADEDGAYKKICPTGGPGGLICCETCMQNYSQYMSQTAQDIESCRIENARKEVTDLLGFVRDTRVAMQKNMRLARRQPPPAVPASFKSSKLGRKAGGSSGATAASFPEWNATSSIDIGALGASASV